jgi:hypothetical protein
MQWTDVHDTFYLFENKGLCAGTWHSVCVSANNIHAAAVCKRGVPKSCGSRLLKITADALYGATGILFFQQR